MKTLTIQQNLTHSNSTHITKPHQFLHQHHHHNLRQTQPPPSKSWQLHSGPPRGFTGTPREKKQLKTNTANKNNDDDDDKIPEVVWERMIKRILFYVGVPLGTGFALLQVFSVLKRGGSFNVPIWLPFLTTFVTFGASVLGIAYGSLSTSLDAEIEGSVMGFEQVEKNWGEMWKEENESGSSKID